jgi:hypothetical protein
MSYRRYQFEATYAGVYAVPSKEFPEAAGFVVSIDAKETFHELVKRLAQFQPEDQVKLACYALENEMAERSR